MEKVRDLRRNGTNSPRRRSEDSGRRLSSLIPGRRRSKIRAGRDENGRQPSADSERLESALAQNRSDTSLNRDGSGNSSLLTDDNSDPDGKLARPSLSPNPSHAGYLTLSSPELQSAVDSPSRATAGVASNSDTDYPRSFDSSSDHLTHSQDRQLRQLSEAGTPLSRSQTNEDLRSEEVNDYNNSASPGAAGTPSAPSRRDTVSTVSLPNSESTCNSPRSDQAGTPRKHERHRLNTASQITISSDQPDTPTTYVTPPTPTDFNSDAATFESRSPPAAKVSNSKPVRLLNSSKHRRSQSANLPSKLSLSEAAPLSPTLEETKTPGGTLTSGFFSSFLSAAQKAADQLNIGVQSSTGKSKETSSARGEDRLTEEASDQENSFDRRETNGDRHVSAIETLGTGDLNFSHLGLSESTEPSAMDYNGETMSQRASMFSSNATRAEEEAATKRAVSAAYEKIPQAASAPAANHTRPLSNSSNDLLTLGEATPPRNTTDLDSLRRTGSVRSKVSGRRRRHRNSSATAGTSNSIGAALAASGTGLVNPGQTGLGQRLTGFAVASSKRNRDFHQLFRSVPEDDYLIEDYSAALQRDILLHGRLYVSESHICFSSNILGWVTHLVIHFDEVVSVEKKSTAVIFPNAIVIQTTSARNVFASFVARDSTYELLIGIWKISHPNLKSSLNGVTLDTAGTGDKTEVVDAEDSDAEDSESGSDDEVYDEDADDVGSFTDAALAPSVTGSDVGDNTLSRKPSAFFTTNGALSATVAAPKGLEGIDLVAAGSNSNTDYPGPSTHEPTQCNDEHYDRPLIDAIIPAPLGQIYSLMYGPKSGTFMRKWHIEDQKSRDINLPDDKIGLDSDHRTLTFEYIKPLNAPVGPKQTKCITTNTVIAFDLDKFVTIDCSTVTPDVPSGNIFTTKTRYCLMWAPNNSTRLVANCTIEWTGKSWLRSPIEKGATDGQIEYVKSLVAALTQEVSKSTIRIAPRKGKKKGRRETADTDVINAQLVVPIPKEEPKPNWGLFEPVRPVLGPLVGSLQPAILSQVLVSVLLALMLFNWFGPPRSHAGVMFRNAPDAEGVSAYENCWRREEGALWDWLEDRAGLSNTYSPEIPGDKHMARKAPKVGATLKDDVLNERQVDDAIRITEERLSALKEAVARRRSTRTKAGA